MVSGYYTAQCFPQPFPLTPEPSPIQTNTATLLGIEIQFFGRLDPFGSCCSSYHGQYPQYPLVRDMECGTAKKVGFSTPALSIAALQKSVAYKEIAELVKVRFPGFKIHGADNLQQVRSDTEIHCPLGYRKMGQVIYITDSQGTSTNPFSSRNPWSTGDPPAYESPIQVHKVPIPKPPPPPPFAHSGYPHLAQCSWNGTPLPPLPPPALLQDSDPFDDVFDHRGPVPALSRQIITPVTPPQANLTPPPMACQIFPPDSLSAEWSLPQQLEPTNIPNCLPTAPQMVPPQLPAEQVQPPYADSRVCEVKREVVTWTFGPP